MCSSDLLGWKSAAMPNSVAQADGVQKLSTIVGDDGRPLLTNGYLLKLLGIPEEDIEAMTAEREVAALTRSLNAPANPGA